MNISRIWDWIWAMKMVEPSAKVWEVLWLMKVLGHAPGEGDPNACRQIVQNAFRCRWREEGCYRFRGADRTNRPRRKLRMGLELHFGFWNYFPQKVEVVEFRIAILLSLQAAHPAPSQLSSCQPLSILLLPHVSGYDTMDNTNRVDIKMVGIDTSRVWADYDRFGYKKTMSFLDLELVGWKSPEALELRHGYPPWPQGWVIKQTKLKTTLPTREVSRSNYMNIIKYRYINIGLASG